jgi:hypothetical protein
MRRSWRICGRRCGWRDRKKASASFLKKRSKKLSSIWFTAARTLGAKWAKVFWFFFSKKNALLFFPANITKGQPLHKRKRGVIYPG